MGSGEYSLRFSLHESEPPPPKGDDPYIGDIFGSRYRILSKLAEGAQARLYMGRHLIIKRFVAIKVLLPVLASDRVVVNRFLNEGRAAGTIGHPNIVESLDMGHAPDGAPYLVMELLEGRTLAEEVSLVGPVLVGRAAYIASQIASALSAAHERGIVHRDLKPENVFLVERAGKPDHVKVLDFGISKFNGNSRVTTQKGQFLGTPDYMAPEQIENPASVDERADVYAVGAILYTMLTGEAPFSDIEFPKVLSVICEKEPRQLTSLRPGLPSDLVAIVERAMSKKRELRYQRMPELEEALVPFAIEPRKSGSGVRAAPAAPTSADDVPAAPTVPNLPPLAAAPPPPDAVPQALPAPGALPKPRSSAAVLLAMGALSVGAAALGGWMVIGHATNPVTVTASATTSSVPAAHTSEAPANASDTPSPPQADPEPQAPSSAHASAPPTVVANAVRRPSALPTRAISPVRAPAAPPPAAPEPTTVSTPTAAIAATAPPSASQPPPPPPPTPADPATASRGPPDSRLVASPAARAPAAPAPGTIEPNAVNATVHAHASEVRTCFDRARMNNPDVHGKVMARARVNPDGRVSSAHVASSNANDTRLESCIVAAFGSWQFPAPAGGVAGSVSYTFVFE